MNQRNNSNLRKIRQKSAKGKTNSFVVSQLALRKARGLTGRYKFLFELWFKTKKTFLLPNGIPYKVVDSSMIHANAGEFIPGLNKPFILVSNILSPTERRSVAMHEFREWGMTAGAPEWEKIAHSRAVRQDNPTIRKTISHKVIRWKEAKETEELYD